LASDICGFLHIPVFPQDTVTGQVSARIEWRRKLRILTGGGPCRESASSSKAFNERAGSRLLEWADLPRQHKVNPFRINTYRR
jgi:hypothetical protein